jgi:D-beta-D-heptose 7-phosphate kinase / D-beta-D-heptose 1-phosphate adenosyltransferase
MSPSADTIVERFADLRVLVIGEAMLDAYLLGATERLCREAPVPVVDVDERVTAPGGAANTAANARALGAKVTLLSVIGADAEGEALQDLLEHLDIPTGSLTIDRSRRTLAKQRLVAGGHLLVRFDQGSTDALGHHAERALAARLSKLAESHDAIVVSDYGYGVLGASVIAALAASQARTPRAVVVDSKALGRYRHVGATAVKPNYAEAVALLDARSSKAPRAQWMIRHGRRLLETTGSRIAAVSLDRDGALFFERERPPYRTYARPTTHARAAGAGDTFLATLGLALAAEADLPTVAELASAAAGVVVAKDGTAVCSALELRAAVTPCDKVVADTARLGARLAAYRAAGRRIVMTSGCFDILHRGHITFLNAAKAQGDVLVVALNTDAGVRRLKGADRPINSFDDRAHVLAGLSAVDHIVPFDEATPATIAHVVRPHVYVKGGDYRLDRVPEASVVQSFGGVVRILPYISDRSTTAIIDRIRTPAVDGDAVRVGRLA